MIILLPMVGAGLFGMNMGIMASIMALLLHVIFGAVLRALYGNLPARVETSAVAQH